MRTLCSGGIGVPLGHPFHRLTLWAEPVSVAPPLGGDTRPWSHGAGALTGALWSMSPAPRALNPSGCRSQEVRRL